VTSDIETAPPPGTPAAPEEKKGTLGRMVGALFSPEATFSDVAGRPNLLAPLMIFVIITLASTIVVVPRMDFETMMRDQLEQSGRTRNMSPSDVDRMVRFSVAFGKGIGYSSPIIAIAIWAIIAGVILLAFRLFGGEGTYKQAFSVTLYAWVPLMIKSIITTFVVMSRGSVNPEEMEVMVRSNPAFLVDLHTQRVLWSLLSSLDLFTIWTLVLLIIGFAFVSRTSKARSAAIVIGLWAFALLIKLGFAALGAAKARAAAAS
jgi:membrane protein, antimicrobial resistance system